jgi:glycosyltransferase involved in cell wall biosynthesis
VIQPLVSIVTPSYHQGRFLEATIRSVLEQDYPNIEYIIIDGASSDNSVEIIRKYSDRISWWVSEKDSGQSEAVNKGFRRAQGEYVGWINSDDLYMPGAVSAAVHAFQSFSPAAIVYGDALAIDENGKAFNLMRARQYSLIDLLAFNIVCQPAAFMRRSVLEQVDYLDQGYQLLMDKLLARTAPIKYIPKTWAAARYHDQAKNRTRGSAYGQEARVLIQDLRSRPEFAEIIAANKKKIMAGVNRFDAFYLTDAGQPGNALRTYWRAFCLHPPAALHDWKHILLASLSLLGFQQFRDLYNRIRTHSLKLGGK